MLENRYVLFLSLPAPPKIFLRVFKNIYYMYRSGEVDGVWGDIHLILRFITFYYNDSFNLWSSGFFVALSYERKQKNFLNIFSIILECLQFCRPRKLPELLPVLSNAARRHHRSRE